MGPPEAYTTENPPVSSEVLEYDNLREPNTNLHGLEEVANTGTLIKVYDAECPDVSLFEYDRLKLFLHYRTGACRFNHMWEEVDPVTINLKVKGIPKPKNMFRNEFGKPQPVLEISGSISSHGKEDTKVMRNMTVRICKYYPPFTCTYIDDNAEKGHWNLPIARLEEIQTRGYVGARRRGNARWRSE